MRKAIAILLSLFGLATFSTANAADLPLKAKPRPPAEPTWWVSGGALIWSVKSTPLPPTLTSFAAGSPSATTGFGGQLGVAGTSVLSPDHLNFGPFGGGRFELGHWLADPRFGVELGGFFLASGNAGFSAASNGTTPLRVPFVNVGAGFPLGSSSFVLADPGLAAGSQSISSSLQLWGIEGNGLYRAVSSGPLNVSVLAGLRYIDLRENLSIVSTENRLPAVGLGTAVLSDGFATRNQFVGGQIGVKAQQQFGPFDISGAAKVALGDNYQTVSVNGASTASGAFLGFGAAPSSPGGLFAQTTNIGQQTRNQFAVVPEADIQVGYRLPNNVRLFAGYDFFYISNVVRPGNQIDTTINFSSNPTINGVGSTLAGPARPAPMINGSSFWAQGVRLGASYTF